MGEITEWRQSLSKTFLVVLGNLLFVVIGGACAFGILVVERYDPLVTRIVGWVAMVFFLLTLIGWTRRLFLGKSVIIRVDEKGIHDRRLSREPIPWESIEDVTTEHLNRTGQIRLQMSSGDKKRFLRPMARLLCWPDRKPAIATVNLEPSLEDLRFTIRHFRRREQRPEPRS